MLASQAVPQVKVSSEKKSVIKNEKVENYPIIYRSHVYYANKIILKH